MRSIGEAFMHVASEYYVHTSMAYGVPRSPVIARAEGAMEKFEASSSKVDVLRQLIAYSRMNGIASPWSK